MIAGPPGSGKSALALNYALRAGVDNLYVSSDMPGQLVVRRSLQITQGMTEDEVRSLLETPQGREESLRILFSLDHMFMTYPARPDAETVAKSIMATMEILGVPPPLVIIDNLMNMNSGNDNEWAGLRELAQVSKFIAKELDIVVLALHHTHTGVSDLSRPVPMSAIMGKISELPAVILTLAKGLYSPVKNRYGKADPMANIVHQLDYDGATQIFSDPKPPEVSYRSRHEEYQDWRERAYKS